MVRVRTPRGSMELKALVTPTIRPDTLFIPFHYGHAQAVNQLTNPAVEPNVKIPEYKACAAALERLDAPIPVHLEQKGDGGRGHGPKLNLTPVNAPEMFPYASGEATQDGPEEGKTY
ncbi:Assimilatory nitrate reductase catalytic subunit [compost metagenome]